MASIAVAVTIVVAAMLCVVPRSLIILSAVPAAYLSYRLSTPVIAPPLAHAFLLLAACAGLLSSRCRDAALRSNVLLPVAAYLAVLAGCVAARPSSAALFELADRSFLLLGGIAVGTSISVLGLEGRAYDAFILSSFLIAAISIADALSGGLGAAYPLGLHKNFAGGLISVAIILVISRLGTISNTARLSLLAVLGTGLLATQSRGAIVSLAVALIYIALRRRGDAWAITGGVVAALVAIGGTALALNQRAQDPLLDPVDTRLDFQQVAVDQWQDQPLFGQGLRYYLDPAYNFPLPAGAPPGELPSPHNVVLETLSESGLIGFTALILLIISVVVFVLPNSRWGVAAGATQIALVIHSLVDLYWLPGLTPLAWILASIAATQFDSSNRGYGRARDATIS